jgi:hypothetical protein
MGYFQALVAADFEFLAAWGWRGTPRRIVAAKIIKSARVAMTIKIVRSRKNGESIARPLLTDDVPSWREMSVPRRAR